MYVHSESTTTPYYKQNVFFQTLRIILFENPFLDFFREEEMSIKKKISFQPRGISVSINLWDLNLINLEKEKKKNFSQEWKLSITLFLNWYHNFLNISSI